MGAKRCSAGGTCLLGRSLPIPVKRALRPAHRGISANQCCWRPCRGTGRAGSVRQGQLAAARCSAAASSLARATLRSSKGAPSCDFPALWLQMPPPSERESMSTFVSSGPAGFRPSCPSWPRRSRSACAGAPSRCGSGRTKATSARRRTRSQRCARLWAKAGCTPTQSLTVRSYVLADASGRELGSGCCHQWLSPVRQVELTGAPSLAVRVASRSGRAPRG